MCEEETKPMKKNKQIVSQNTFTDFLLYTTPNGKVKVEYGKTYSTKFYNLDDIWLNTIKKSKRVFFSKRG